MDTKPDEFNAEQLSELQRFANLTEVMKLKQEDIAKLGEQRQKSGERLVKLGVQKRQAARFAGLSEQAIYKIFQKRKPDASTDE